MARYELVAYDRKTSQEYVIPLKNKQNNKLTMKNDLFEIDAITAKYETMHDLQVDLKKCNCIPTDVVDLKIRYFHNKEQKFLDVIIGNTMLYQTCLVLIQKKKNKIKIDVDILKEPTRAFYYRILSYMKDEETSTLLLQNDYNLVPYRLRELVIPYYTLCQKNFLTPKEVFEKNELEKSILYILEKYKNLRGLCLWKNYLENHKIKKRGRNVSIEGGQGFGYHPSVPKEIVESDPDEYMFLEDDEKKAFFGYEDEATYRFKGK